VLADVFLHEWGHGWTPKMRVISDVIGTVFG
jgi:hypothetical protein